MATKVMTAPLAIIKVNGSPVGKMKNIRVTETIRRGRVSGLGELTPQELPALEWNGTLTCQFYSISLQETGIPNALIRKVPALQDWIDNVLLQEDGVDVVLYKKIKDQLNTSTGLIEAKLEEFGQVKGAFVDREAFDISEGQISGKDQDFTYMFPILFSL